MTLGQLTLVMLATVLFATIVVGLYNNMSNQVSMAENYVYYSQSLKLADAVFQRLEAQHLGFHTPFLDLLNPAPPDTVVISSTKYIVSYEGYLSDALGAPDPLSTDYITVHCLIEIYALSGNKVLSVGNVEDKDERFRKVFRWLGT